MKQDCILVVVLILLLVTLIYFGNCIIRSTLKRETFYAKGSPKLYKNYIDEMKYDNETMVKFCKKLRLLDKPNEYNLLLMKMKEESIDKNEETIEELLAEIDTLQKEIVNNDIDLKNVYRLHTHNQAKNKLNVVNKALENVQNRNKVNINLK